MSSWEREVSVEEKERVTAALAAVQDEVASCSEQTGRAVQLVAVSKMKPAALVRACYDAGQRAFGENYVQQLVEKAAQLPEDVEWHYIGALQSNKARALLAVPNVRVVETVDREKAARALQRAAEELDRGVGVMLQVNTGGEESKAGAAPEAARGLLQFVREHCPRLQVRGLMTIGRPGEAADLRALAALRDQLVAEGALAAGEDGLSMGMSGDFREAIALGSTSVRVGSTIFGAR